MSSLDKNPVATITPDNSTLRELRAGITDATSQTATSLSAPSVLSLSITALQRATALRSLEQIADFTGGFVRLMPDHSFTPAVIGSDGKPVYLYHIIESFDEFLDFDRVLKAFPTLGFSHIHSTIAFLRRVSQINSEGIDFDLQEEERDFDNPEFVRQLTEALDRIDSISRVYPNPD